MRTGDKELLFWLAVAIGVLLLLTWAFGRRATPGGGGMLPALSPYTTTVPGFPDLMNVEGGTIDVDVHGTPLAWIAPYFPLFGFVGVDATQIYQ